MGKVIVGASFYVVSQKDKKYLHQMGIGNSHRIGNERTPVSRRNYRCSSPSRFPHTLRCPGHVALALPLPSTFLAFGQHRDLRLLRGCPWSAVGCSAPFSSGPSFIFSVTSRYVFICSRFSCLNTFDITARFRSEILPRYVNRCRFKGEFPWRRIEESQKLSPF